LDYRQWLRGPLKRYSEELLTGSHSFAADLVGRKVVRRMLEDHTSGVRNTLLDISALMNLELINKCLFQQDKQLTQRQLTSLFSVNN